MSASQEIQNQAIPEEPAPIKPPRPFRFYIVSVAVTFLFLGIIAIIWYRVLSMPFTALPTDQVITTTQELNNYLGSQLPPPTATDGPFLFRPALSSSRLNSRVLIRSRRQVISGSAIRIRCPLWIKGLSFPRAIRPP